MLQATSAVVSACGTIAFTARPITPTCCAWTRAQEICYGTSLMQIGTAITVRPARPWWCKTELSSEHRVETTEFAELLLHTVPRAATWHGGFGRFQLRANS